MTALIRDELEMLAAGQPERRRSWARQLGIAGNSDPTEFGEALKLASGRLLEVMYVDFAADDLPPVAEEEIYSKLATAGIWPQRGMRIFLSYSNTDEEAARGIARALRPFKVTCFVAPDSIRAGASWDNELLAALRTSDAVLALCSEAYGRSAWCNQELGIALQAGKPIVGVDWGGNPPGFLARKQTVRGKGSGEEELAVSVLGAFQHEMGALLLSSVISSGWPAYAVASNLPAPKLDVSDEGVLFLGKLVVEADLPTARFAAPIKARLSEMQKHHPEMETHRLFTTFETLGVRASRLWKI